MHLCSTVKWVLQAPAAAREAGWFFVCVDVYVYYMYLYLYIPTRIESSDGDRERDVRGDVKDAAVTDIVVSQEVVKDVLGSSTFQPH